MVTMKGGMRVETRQLGLDDIDAAAAVHRTAFDAALPWLAGRYTPAQDRWFYRERMFAECRMWGAFDGLRMIAVIAFRTGWIDQLYVLPDAQGTGVGTSLVHIAQGAFDLLRLWTYQRNAHARRFYQRRGFVLAETTDGARNEEKEPDALYRWDRAARIRATVLTRDS